MNRKPIVARSILAVGTLLSLTLSACAGGGSSSGTAGILPSTPTSDGKTTALITIKWPTAGASSAAIHRSRQYVSDATASVTIAAAGTTTEVDNPNLTPGGTSAPTQTTSSISVPIPPSSTATTFTVNAYDKKGAAGNLLGSGTTSAVIVIDKANAVAITLNGNLGSVACAAVAPYDTAIGTTGTAFKQVGISGTIALTPKDPDGYTIVMPGLVPTLTLAAVTPAMASATATSTTNQFTTTVTPVGTAENFTASGTDLSGATHSTTCSITRDAALYVSNVGKQNAPGQQSITIYDATTFVAAAATTAQAPIATITAPTGAQGTTTDQADVEDPQFMAVDSKGYLFVTNQGPLPNGTFGAATGYVAIYAPGAGQNGNAAPYAFIRNLSTPEGIAFDSSGTLYVMTVNSILEYPPSANGETATAVPSVTITGSNTDLNSCYGLSIDTAGSIYAACSDVIDIFAKGSTGNATPTLIELPLMTTMTFDSASWLDVAPDSTLAFYAPASNNNVAANTVYAFPAGATSGTTSTTAASTTFSQPTGIAIDPSNGIYITNFGSSTVQYFSSSTILTTGIATSTLSGAATNLNYPFGVTVK